MIVSETALSMRDDHRPFYARSTANTPLTAGIIVHIPSYLHLTTLHIPVLDADAMHLLRGLRAVLDALLPKAPPVRPTLPPELERKIFELAAIAYPECASTLVLVAHRTLIWCAQPILFASLSHY